MRSLGGRTSLGRWNLFGLVVAGAAWLGCPAGPAAPAAATGAAPEIAIPNASRAIPGVLAGGLPTAAQLEEAKAKGFKAVIDLRTEAEDTREEGQLVPRLGMLYVQIPIAGPEDLTEANARGLAQVLADASAQPALVHCRSGNRVGALFALKAHYVDGLPVEEAIELGKRAGLTSLELAVRKRLGGE